MSEREKLPARRNTIVIDVRFPRGTLLTVPVQVGFYPDWRIGEFFIGAPGKIGSDGDTAAKNFAVVTSIALQHGAPLELMAQATLKTVEGLPDGIAGVVLEALVALQKAVWE